MTWLTFWTLFLVLSVGLFSVLVVVITVGAGRELRDLLRNLRK